MKQAVLTEADVAVLAASFQGRLIGPGDSGYDEARAVFNGMIDRRPALIARCAAVEDVIAALRFARARDLIVAVRGGGHSMAGHAVCDGGVVVDLSFMREVSVDPAAGTATAQGGTTWGDFDAATQAFGLATTGGRRTTTGIGGQTLGSGSGWLERKLGLTMDNLLSAELVTASGSVVVASDTENSDLFWGLRGGGGNFGVVTSFTYRLHSVGPVLLGGLLVYRSDDAPEVLRLWRDYMDAAPDALGTGVAFVTAPPLPFVPEALWGQPVMGIFVCYAGPVDEGEKALRPLREIRAPAADLVEPMPYTAVQSLIDDAMPPGRQQYWKAENMTRLSDSAIDVVLDGAARVTSPFTMLVVEAKGRAISRVGEHETAFGHRDAAYSFYSFTSWDDRASSEGHIAWTRELMGKMAPFTTPGISLNFTSEQDQERVRSFFGGGEKYERLVALKRAYDPENVFRLNHNIEPGPPG